MESLCTVQCVCEACQRGVQPCACPVISYVPLQPVFGGPNRGAAAGNDSASNGGGGGGGGAQLTRRSLSGHREGERAAGDSI